MLNISPTDRRGNGEIPPQDLLPCCGRCQHFEERDIDGISGVCRALFLQPVRSATDQICEIYNAPIPVSEMRSNFGRSAPKMIRGVSID